MTIHELVSRLHTLASDHDMCVACLKTDGTGEIFDITAVQDNHGHAQLDIYEEEDEISLETGNGAVSTPDAVEVATEAFLEICARRGMTEEEQDLIWNAMAFICYEQVQHRHGPFYEAIKPLFADDEANPGDLTHG